MSWSVSACGPAAKVAEQLEQQFEKCKMSDEGEQATVQNTRQLVTQTLATIDPEGRQRQRFRKHGICRLGRKNKTVSKRRSENSADSFQRLA